MPVNINLTNEYDYNQDNKVWIKKNAPAFIYSDGENVETGIGEILDSVQDKSVFSDELKRQQTNWPTVYYFSANRSNLLRPLTENLISGARVLELGCGMGAITRYLGENASEVYAVEGSLRRGNVAAKRCEDLKNVHILIDEIKALPESLGKFDVVTLIGVLEYACRYGGPGAEREILRKAKTFLKPDGALILAIENKLGLKYFAGIPEDHLQRSWLGITNGYAENGVKTWSRKELLSLLKEEGFCNCEQFLALPDYKLPTTIVSPSGLSIEKSDFDLTPLLNNTKRLFEPLALFNMAEAWESIYNAGLLADFADSLCFVASVNENRKSSFERGNLVSHYGDLSSLPKKYSKEVKINKKGEQFEVKRKKLIPMSSNSTDEFIQKVEDEPYYKGELLSSQIRKIAMRPDWTLEEFFSAFQPWIDLLKENMDENGYCDGELMDLTPFNMVFNNSKVEIFDQEWVANKKLPFVFLLYRGFLNTVLRMLPLRRSVKHNITKFSDLFKEFIKSQHLSDSFPISLDYLWWQEVKFMKFIKNNPKYSSIKDFPIVYMQ